MRNANIKQPIIDPDIGSATGRVVFYKNHSVGRDDLDTKEAVFSFLFAPYTNMDWNIYYNIYEVIDGTLSPIKRINPDDKFPFYVDLSAGDHTFFVIRSNEMMFKKRLWGNVAVIKLSIEEGKTHPIIFGIDNIFSTLTGGNVVISYYRMNEEDIKPLYNIRAQNLSENERRELFKEKYSSSTYSFQLAAAAVLFMQRRETLDEDFIKWTNSKESEILEKFNSASIGDCRRSLPVRKTILPTICRQDIWRILPCSVLLYQH